MASASSPVSTITSSIKSTAGALTSGLKPQENELGRWRRTFERHATDGPDGKKYLNPSQFIDAIAPPEEGFHRIKREQYSLLFRVADVSQRGLVSFEDFVVFETLLKRPDADYQLAFQVFDVDASGSINFDEFKEVLNRNIVASGIPFDFDSPWLTLYLGKKDGRHVLGYTEFSQLVKGYTGERMRQAFHYFDKDGDGYIGPTEFQRIIVEIAGHKLSDSVLERLPTLCTMNPGRKISYSEVIAFNNVIREMDAIERLITRAVRKSKDGKIDQGDFLNEAAGSMRYSMFTPMEADIIWHFSSRGAVGGNTRLRLADFQALLDPKWQPPQSVDAPEVAADQSFLSTVGESVYHFLQGGLAGGLGAFAVYPIDLVKTRLQNQRSTVVGEVLYRSPADCVRKVYANEGGVRGFYKGVIPQLVGVAPEKAIKLTVNDMVRKKVTDPETGRISLGWEFVAGGTAGGCQVAVTNPLEILKIRLQMAGEMARAEGGNVKPVGAITILRQLGLIGLYKGATACFARDIPFSMIYFTAYAHMKKDIFHEGRRGKQLSFGELMLAAGISGMPAAYLTTPADVVKTRLQSQARAGETVYKGIFDGFKTILREEGPRALFKGGIARVIRSSPQFAVTLSTYELLNKYFPYPFGDEAHSKAGQAASGVQRPFQATDISRIRAMNGLRILLDCSSQFGMVGPEAVAKGVQNLPPSLKP